MPVPLRAVNAYFGGFSTADSQGFRDPLLLTVRLAPAYDARC
jgi:hypothetical protein